MQAGADKLEEADLKFTEETRSRASQTVLFRWLSGKGPVWYTQTLGSVPITRQGLWKGSSRTVAWFSMKAELWYFTIMEILRA